MNALSTGRSLLSARDLSSDEALGLLGLAEALAAKVASGERARLLEGRQVALAFFEPSTRTRLSFERAAVLLGASVTDLSAGTSSMSKGESVRDTVVTLRELGADALVVRHRSSGVPAQVEAWTARPVVNAGDGCHQHPTQALADALALCRRWWGEEWTALAAPGWRPFSGRRVAVVGDVAHSRVARSLVDVLVPLGASVVLVAPPALVPGALHAWPVELAGSLDDVVSGVDALYLLRIQRERLDPRLVPSIDAYRRRFGLDERRADRLGAATVILHPGPVNRGTELASAVADSPRSLIGEQVRAGLSVRMAVLLRALLGLDGLPSDLVSRTGQGLGILGEAALRPGPEPSSAPAGRT